MTAIAIARPKIILPGEIRLTEAAELLRGGWERKSDNRLFDHILLMSGSVANYASKALGDLLFGKTTYAGETTCYLGLWTAALDSTFTGATASEATYTSYARLALSETTTLFAAGTGTTSYVKTFPSDALHSWATATGGSSTVTYLGGLNGNAGTSADKGLFWCSVSSVTVANGDTPQIAQNAISVTFGG